MNNNDGLNGARSGVQEREEKKHAKHKRDDTSMNVSENDLTESEMIERMQSIHLF